MTHGPNLALAQSLTAYLVDDRVGIVHALNSESVRAGTPNFFQYSAYPCDTRSLFKRSCVRRVGAAAADPAQSRAKALFRAASVYCASFCEPERFPLCASDE